MKCDCCGKEVNSDITNTCLTAHVDLNDLGLDESKACSDDFFYCHECLNENNICKSCSSYLSEEEQININLHYES